MPPKATPFRIRHSVRWGVAMHVHLLETRTDLRTLFFHLLRAGAPDWTISFSDTLANAKAHCESARADIFASTADFSQAFRNLRAHDCTVARVLLTTPQAASEDLSLLGVVHQAIPLPCASAELVRALEKAKEIATQGDEAVLARFAGGLPPGPRTWSALREVLRSDAAHTQSVTRVLRADPVISALVLQMANSALFGRGAPIDTLESAVSRLGLQRLASLVLSIEFAQLMGTSVPAARPQLARAQALAIDVGELAHHLAPARLKDMAYTAGTLHALGQMLLITHDPAGYGALKPPPPLAHLEFRAFGASTAQLSGSLLRVWGLSETVVRAVRYRDNPRALGPHRFELPDTLHVCAALLAELNPAVPTAGLDEALLVKQGVWPHVEAWRAHLRTAWESRNTAC